MKISFSKKEIELILDSLEFTKKKFEEYQHYPDEEFKKSRINEAANLILKIKKIKES
jgi:hypothetical protein